MALTPLSLKYSPGVAVSSWRLGRLPRLDLGCSSAPFSLQKNTSWPERLIISLVFMAWAAKTSRRLMVTGFYTHQGEACQPGLEGSAGCMDILVHESSLSSSDCAGLCFSNRNDCEFWHCPPKCSAEYHSSCLRFPRMKRACFPKGTSSTSFYKRVNEIMAVVPSGAIAESLDFRGLQALFPLFPILWSRQARGI